MAQVHRPEVDGSWRGAVELLAKRPQSGAQAGDLVRLVSVVHRVSGELGITHLVFKDHHLRRVGNCHSAAARRVYGAGSLLRWINEWELHHGRVGFHQWNVVRHSHVACFSLEKCRLDWP